MTVRVDHTSTSGTFSLDGRTLHVENNVWVVGNDDECLVIDAPHDADAIMRLVGERKVTAILLTHGHDDHLGAAGALWDASEGALHLHPADRMLWNRVYAGVPPDAELDDEQLFTVGDVSLHVIHTPGHTPGSVCFHVPALGTVFTGDTLLPDGPGTAWGSFSDAHATVASIRDRLLPLPPDTVVRAGHGVVTTLSAATSTLRSPASR